MSDPNARDFDHIIMESVEDRHKTTLLIMHYSDHMLDEFSGTEK